MEGFAADLRKPLKELYPLETVEYDEDNGTYIRTTHAASEDKVDLKRLMNDMLTFSRHLRQDYPLNDNMQDLAFQLGRIACLLHGYFSHLTQPEPLLQNPPPSRYEKRTSDGCSTDSQACTMEPPL